MTELKFPVLIGDIGGTNARFQVLPDATSPAVGFDHARTADFASIEEAIRQCVLEKTTLKPETAILAAAGPITKDGLDLTNSDWAIRPDRFLGFSSIASLTLFNDFDAQALALPFLQPGDLTRIGDADLSRDNGNRVVLGPGTGLGVGALIHANGTWIPVGGEGGHVDLGPRDNREIEIWKYLERFDGRVSAESILCGSGLMNAYQAICAADDVDPNYEAPHEVTAAAMDGGSERADNQAHEALSLFCRCLGRVAGDLAVTVLPRGGVYIGGGIARKIATFLERSDFRHAFEDKAPHKEIVSSIPTLLITHDVPALLGLESFARNPDQFGITLDHRQWSRC